MDRNTACVALLVIAIVGIAAGPAIVTGSQAIMSGIYTFFNPTTPPTTTTPTTLPPGVEMSKFSFPLNAEDTSTATASMTVTAWYDENGDGRMTANELRLCSDSSGTYTTGKEYPIGASYDIWLQFYGTNYQTGYAKVHMSGSRNSDGSAKLLDESVFIRATDDSMVYNGLINNIGWDDSTDYNATTSGTSGTAQVSIVLSAADKGISSRVWNAVDYRVVYSTIFSASSIDINNYNKPFWIKWDQVAVTTDNMISKNAILAPDFFGIYMTIQDKIDLAPQVTDFDLYGDDNTNYYMAAFVSDSWGDLMYNTADPSAPQPSVTFQVGTITAAGTTVATYGVAIRTGLTYEQMVSFLWTASATYYLGTAGNDWDFVV